MRALWSLATGGAKHTAGASELIRQGIEDMGCPTLILDGDGADRSNNMSGQMNTRLEAFLELVARGEVDNGRH
ncbi:MAG: 2-hydroxyacyl-CoA dehydratase [Atopobiaceae bacterium]